MFAQQIESLQRHVASTSGKCAKQVSLEQSRLLEMEDVLWCVRAAKQGTTIKNVVRITGLQHTKVSRILSRLEEFGKVRREGKWNSKWVDGAKQ